MLGSRIKQTTNTGGTGDINLNAAVAGFESFKDAIGIVGTRYVRYLITNGLLWEEGIGRLVAGTPDVLKRDYVLESSASDGHITLDGTTFIVAGGIPPEIGVIGYNTQAGAYSLLATDWHKEVQYTGSTDRTWPLPKVAEVGDGFETWLRHAGNAGVLTLDPDGTEQIEGATTLALRPGMVVKLAVLSGAWRVQSGIGYHPATTYLSGKTLDQPTVASPTLNGEAKGTLFGIEADRVPRNGDLGALAYAETVEAADLRGTASRIMGTDASGIGQEVQVGTGLAFSAGVISNPRSGCIDVVQTYTPSNAASVAITHLDWTTYRIHRVWFRGVSPVGGGSIPSLRTSSNGGSSYDSGAGNYDWGVRGITSNTDSNGSTNSDTEIQLTGAIANTEVGSSAGQELKGWFEIYEGGLAEQCVIHWMIKYRNSAGGFSAMTGSGTRLASSLVNAVEFRFLTQNCTGTLVLEGVRR